MSDDVAFEEMAPGPLHDDPFPCKVEGCTGIAKSNRGRYAYLCPVHAAEPGRSPSRTLNTNGAATAARDYRSEAQQLRRRADALDAVADALAQLEVVEA